MIDRMTDLMIRGQMINHQIGIGALIAIDHQIRLQIETEIQIDQAQTGIIKGMIHPEDPIGMIEEVPIEVDQIEVIEEDRTETIEEDQTEMIGEEEDPIEHHQTGVKTQIQEAENWKDRVRIGILTGKTIVQENPGVVQRIVTAVELIKGVL